MQKILFCLITLTFLAKANKSRENLTWSVEELVELFKTGPRPYPSVLDPNNYLSEESKQKIQASIDSIKKFRVIFVVANKIGNDSDDFDELAFKFLSLIANPSERSNMLLVMYDIEYIQGQWIRGSNMTKFITAEECVEIAQEVQPQIKANQLDDAFTTLFRLLANKKPSHRMHTWLKILIAFLILGLIVGLLAFIVFQKKGSLVKQSDSQVWPALSGQDTGLVPTTQDRIDRRMKAIKAADNPNFNAAQFLQTHCVVCLEKINDQPSVIKSNRRNSSDLSTPLLAEEGPGGLIEATGMVVDGNLATLPCGHKFHADCIKSWIVGNMECPACKFQNLSADFGERGDLRSRGKALLEIQVQGTKDEELRRNLSNAFHSSNVVV